jgi:outer membrane lipoprotein-sorting protein
MSGNRKVAVILVFGALLLGGSRAAAQRQHGASMQDRQREQRSLAANMVRAINAAEKNYKTKSGAYAGWDTLVNNEDFTNTGTKWAPESLPTVAHAMYGSGPEIVPGWRLRLTISKDGNAYDLRLEDVNDPKCRFAIVSDESGMIRQSQSISCPL